MNVILCIVGVMLFLFILILIQFYADYKDRDKNKIQNNKNNIKSENISDLSEQDIEEDKDFYLTPESTLTFNEVKKEIIKRKKPSYCVLCGLKRDRDGDYCFCCGYKFEEQIENFSELERSGEILESNYISEYNRTIEAINFILEKGINLVYQNEDQKAHTLFSSAFNLIEIMLFSCKADGINEEKVSEIHLFYSECIKLIMMKWRRLIDTNELKNTVKKLSTGIQFIDSIIKMQQNGEDKDLLQDVMFNIKNSNIEIFLKNSEKKFTRLYISEIAELFEVSEDIIVRIVNDMIRKEELHANYFKSTNSIVFNLQEALI